ncbi:hypothetical protein ARMGADRAFT_1037958 [Armillaria gallica]|uniref:Uncharacterized protein n=1 Tax=Armillaria gallica TaxID=47427 RepID=A0A2H3D4T2_ARMGA|nr:hypothetical protein ARMGADRAFT_1037958 [Armillaria gallica]
MPLKPYICFCHPGGHELLSGKEKISHLLELKAKKRLQQQMSLRSVFDHDSTLDNPTSPSLESDIEELTTKMVPLMLRGDTPEPVDELAARMAPLVLTDDGPEPVPHADDLTAHILTEGVPILTQQPSKLWLTSSQLEEPEDPVELQDAKQSLNHIDTSTKLLLQRMSALLLADLSSDEVASSRKQLTEIALELKSLRESLSHVKYGHEDAFKEQNVAIVKVFHEIEGRWTMADAILPPAEESSEPLLYTTGLNRIMCNMIITTLALIVRLTMAANLMEDSKGGCSLDPNQEIIMDQLPSSLHTAHPSYPSHCKKKNPGPSGLVVCGASLLKGGKDGALKPQKPFLMASLEDFIRQTLADPNIEMLCDKACDDAMESLKNPMDPQKDTKNVFEADFMHQFKGPNGRTLFID